MVGLGGLEPPTSRLSSARSNQLSYKPLDRAFDRLRHRDDVSQGRPAVAACAAPSRSASSRRLRYGARAQVKVIREERETKAAGAACKVDVKIDYLPSCSEENRKEDAANGIPLGFILRKEVIQPQVPLRLPCYDFTPVADPTVVSCLLAVSTLPSGKANSHGVTGGVYKARERIHRGMLIRDY